MQIGISYWFGYPSLQDERIALLKNAGFEEVSLHWTNEYETITGEKHSIPLLLEKSGIHISSLHLSFERSYLLWDYSSDGKEYRKSIIKAIEDARALAVNTIVMHSDGKMGNNIQLSDIIGPLMDKAEQKDIRLCVENLQHEDNLSAILEDSYLRSIPLCYDTGHANIRKCQFAIDKNEQIKYIHIHDNDGLYDTHQLPFTGTINWEKTIGVLRQYSNVPKILEIHKDMNNRNEVERYLYKAHKIAAYFKEKLEQDIVF